MKDPKKQAVPLANNNDQSIPEQTNTSQESNQKQLPISTETENSNPIMNNVKSNSIKLDSKKLGAPTEPEMNNEIK